MLFQSGALWSALTVGENMALPLQIFTRLDAAEIRRLVALKLEQLAAAILISGLR